MASTDRTQRQTTRHRGITYREKANGEKRYSVYFKGRYISEADNGAPLLRLDQAIERQGQLTGLRRRGEDVQRSEKVSFEAAADAWLEHATSRPRKPLSADTAKEYRRFLANVLVPRFGQRLIGSISPEEIERFTAELLQKHNSESAVANTLKPLRGTLDFAHRHKKWIGRNPAKEISDDFRVNCNATREHHRWTTEEVDRLIELGYERDLRPTAHQEYGLAIETKIRLALRLGELLGLQYRDIALEEIGGERRAIVTLKRQWSNSGQVKEWAKTKAGLRRIPVTAALYKKIAERKLRLGAGGEDFVFAAKRGANPPQQSNFRRRGWNAAVKEAGLRVEGGVRITPHDARHAAVSQWAHLGASAAQVTSFVGHTNSR
jgi:integrase